jgi:hypothetical protein
MQRLPLEQQILVILQIVTLLAVCVRIWWSGLYLIYRYFFAYLLLAFFQITILASVPFDSLLYRDAWVATEGLIVCTYGLVVLELCTVVLRDLVGIATVSRRYVKVALGLAILISLLLLGLEKTPGGIFDYFITFERPVLSSLTFFVFLMTAFLVYYPVPLNRNAIVYSIGYAVYFLAKAAAFFLLNLSHKWYVEFSDFLIAVSTLCLLFWLVALSPSGENKTVVIGHKWRPDDEERLISQLKAINASLGRAARK